MSELMMSSPHNFLHISFTKLTKLSYFSYENVLEQYTRKENVKIYGVKEQKDENVIDVVLGVAKEMGAELSRADLSVCHRLGKPNDNGDGRMKSRTIIARFTRRDAKTTFMKAKKNLRKKEETKNIFVNDDLTRVRSKVFQELRRDPNIVKTWTIDGKIHYVKKGPNGREVTRTMDSLDSLHELGWTEDHIKDLGVYLDL